MRNKSLFGWYERLVPLPMRRLLLPLIDSPTSLRQFVTYILIGLITVVVDFGLLAMLLRTRLDLSVSVTIAYITAATMQFLLNRNYNFRNFDRPILHQARTTLIMVIAVCLFTIVWVEGLVRLGGFAPLTAKALSVPITVAIGFTTSRFVIFGPGLARSIRTWIEKP